MTKTLKALLFTAAIFGTTTIALGACKKKGGEMTDPCKDKVMDDGGGDPYGGDPYGGMEDGGGEDMMGDESEME